MQAEELMVQPSSITKSWPTLAYAFIVTKSAKLTSHDRPANGAITQPFPTRAFQFTCAVG